MIVHDKMFFSKAKDGKYVVNAHFVFDDNSQSMRLIELLAKFIQEEQKEK